MDRHCASVAEEGDSGRDSCPECGTAGVAVTQSPDRCGLCRIEPYLLRLLQGRARLADVECRP